MSVVFLAATVVARDNDGPRPIRYKARFLKRVMEQARNELEQRAEVGFQRCFRVGPRWIEDSQRGTGLFQLEE